MTRMMTRTVVADQIPRVPALGEPPDPGPMLDILNSAPPPPQPDPKPMLDILNSAKPPAEQPSSGPVTAPQPIALSPQQTADRYGNAAPATPPPIDPSTIGSAKVRDWATRTETPKEYADRLTAEAVSKIYTPGATAGNPFVPPAPQYEPRQQMSAMTPEQVAASNEAAQLAGRPEMGVAETFASRAKHSPWSLIPGGGPGESIGKAWNMDWAIDVMKAQQEMGDERRPDIPDRQAYVLEKHPRAAMNLNRSLFGADAGPFGIDQGTTTPEEFEANWDKAQQTAKYIIGNAIEEADNATRGKTFAAGAIEGVYDMIPYMLEFYLTAGIAEGASAATKAAANRLLSRFGKSAVVKAALARASGAAGFAAGEAARTATIGLAKIAADTATAAVDKPVGYDANGKLVTVAGEPVGNAFLKATASTYISYFSEGMGGHITGAVKAGAGAAASKTLFKIPGAKDYVGRLLRGIKKALPKSAKWGPVLKQMKYNGLAGEMSEEAFERVVRSVTKMDDIPVFDALFPGWKPILTEATVLMMPGAAHVGIGAVESRRAESALQTAEAAALAETGRASQAQSDRQYNQVMGEVQAAPIAKVMAANEQGQAQADAAQRESVLRRQADAKARIDRPTGTPVARNQVSTPPPVVAENATPAPVGAPAPQGEGQKPWEMTAGEYEALLTPEARRVFGGFQHRSLVLNALASGESVPARVADEYPGIRDEAKKVAADAKKVDDAKNIREESRAAEVDARQEERSRKAIEAGKQVSELSNKQPWEITLRQYTVGGRITNAMRAAHKAEVQKAQAAGETIPPEVLAEYPDLAKAQETPKNAPTSPPAARTGEIGQTAAPAAEVAPQAAQGTSKPSPAAAKEQGKAAARAAHEAKRAERKAAKAKPLRMDGTVRPEKPAKAPPPALPQKSVDMMDAAIATKDTTALGQMVEPRNKAWRAQFEASTGVTLPAGVKASRAAVEQWAKAALAQPAEEAKAKKGKPRLSDAEKAKMQEEYTALFKRNMKVNGEPRKNAKPGELKRMEELRAVAEKDAAIGRREALRAKDKAEKAWVKETNASLGLKPGQTVTIVSRDGKIKEQGEYRYPEKAGEGYPIRLFVKMQKGGTHMWSPADVQEVKQAKQSQPSASPAGPAKAEAAPDKLTDQEKSTLSLLQSLDDTLNRKFFHIFTENERRFLHMQDLIKSPKTKVLKFTDKGRSTLTELKMREKAIGLKQAAIDDAASDKNSTKKYAENGEFDALLKSGHFTKQDLIGIVEPYRGEPWADAYLAKMEKTAKPEAVEPWEIARENVKPYSDGLRNLSDKELQAEEKRTRDALNKWAKDTPALLDTDDPDTVVLNPALHTVESHEISERFLAVTNEQDLRKSGALLTQQQYFDRWVKATIRPKDRAAFLADKKAVASVRAQTDRSHANAVQDAKLEAESPSAAPGEKAGEQKKEEPDAFLADNKIVKPDAIAAAKARTAAKRKKIKDLPADERGFFDAQAFADYALIGAGYAEAIIRKTGKLLRRTWNAAMRKEDPDLTKQELDEIWSEMRKQYPDVIRQEKEELPPKQPVTGEVVPPSRDVTDEMIAPPAGSGRETARLAEWTEEAAVEKKLVAELGSLPLREYETMDMQEQARMVAELSQDEAVDIAMGATKPANPDLRPASVYVAVANQAVLDGNYDLVVRLATESTIPEYLSKLGQEIKAADARDPLDPIKAIRSIIDTAKQAAERRGAKTEAGKKALAETEARLAEVQKKLDEAIAELEKKGRQLAERKAAADIESQPVRQTRPRKAKAKIFTQEREAAAWKEFNEALSGLQDITSVPGLTAKLVKALTISAGRYLEEGGRKATEWAKQIIEAHGERVRPHLKEAWGKARIELARAETAADIKAKLADNKGLASMQQDVRDLYRVAIADGVGNDLAGTAQIEKRLEWVHEQLADADVTLEEVRDALSGYGKVIVPSQEALEVQLRDEMAQHRELSKLRDMAEGQAPLATGMKRDRPSQQTRELTRKVNEAKKEGGYATTDPQRQLQSYLDTQRTRLTNELADLQKQIAERKRRAKAEGRPALTPELKALRQKVQEAKALLNAIDPKKPAIQSLEAALRHYERRMDRTRARLLGQQREASKRRGWQERPDSPEKRKVAALQKLADQLTERTRTLRGIVLTKPQIESIVDLARDTAQAKARMEAAPRRTSTGGPTAEEMAYGMSATILGEHIGDLKTQANRLTWDDFRRRPIVTPLKYVFRALGLSRAIRAAWDASFPFRQGYKVLLGGDLPDLISLPYRLITGAGKDRQRFVWTRTTGRMFKMIYQTFRGENVMRVLHAEIISDPDFDLMKKGRLAVATIEEAFPEQLPGADRITAWATKPEGSIAARIGRQAAGSIFSTYKASQNAFEGAAFYMRYQMFRRMLDIARKSGVDLTSKNEVESIGRFVNSMTGRGKIGKDRPGLVNALLWAPKLIVSHIDVLTAYTLTDTLRSGSAMVRHQEAETMSRFARVQAAYALAEIVGGIASILALSWAIDPDSVDSDPRSADFGKIKVGNTRFDMTGGMGSLVTLAFRVIPVLWGEGYTKSSTTGKIRKLSTGKFNGPNAMDVLYDFLENKTAPPVGAMVDRLRGEEKFEQNDDGTPVRPRFAKQLVELYKPLPIDALQELWTDPESAPIVVGMMAELMGISANTYQTSLQPVRDFRTEVSPIINAVDELRVMKKPVPFDAQEQYRRATRADGMMADLEKAGDKKRAAEIARAALAGKPIFSTLTPKDKPELKFAYRELAEAKAFGRDAGWRAELDKAMPGLARKDRDEIRKAAESSAATTIRNDFMGAVQAGDAEAAKRYAKARLTFGYDGHRGDTGRTLFRKAVYKSIDKMEADDADKKRMKSAALKAILGRD